MGFVPDQANAVGALEMEWFPDLYPGKQPFADPKVRSRLTNFWGGKLSPLDGLDMHGMISAAHSGRFKSPVGDGLRSGKPAAASRFGPGSDPVPHRPGSVPDRYGAPG